MAAGIGTVGVAWAEQLRQVLDGLVSLLQCLFQLPYAVFLKSDPAFRTLSCCHKCWHIVLVDDGEPPKGTGRAGMALMVGGRAWRGMRRVADGWMVASVWGHVANHGEP